MMNVCILYYDGFSELEVSVLKYCGFQKENVYSAAIEKRLYISKEQQKFLPDKTIDELDFENVDLFIIPGGDPTYLFHNLILKNFVVELNKRNIIIIGILDGVKLMDSYGVVPNKKRIINRVSMKFDDDNINLVKNCLSKYGDIGIEGNIITITGQIFMSYIIELGKILNIFNETQEIGLDSRWLKKNLSLV